MRIPRSAERVAFELAPLPLQPKWGEKCRLDELVQLLDE